VKNGNLWGNCGEKMEFLFVRQKGKILGYSGVTK
jgi:hypothetical protein